MKHEDLDYATIEDRMAALTPEGVPVDFYRVEAARMFRVPEASVTPEQRRAAKRAFSFLRYGPRGRYWPDPSGGQP